MPFDPTKAEKIKKKKKRQAEMQAVRKSSLLQRSKAARGQVHTIKAWQKMKARYEAEQAAENRADIIAASRGKKVV